MMVMHLKARGHSAGDAFKTIDQEQLKMRWQIKDNQVDCGVVLMRIMETYMQGRSQKFYSVGSYKILNEKNIYYICKNVCNHMYVTASDCNK